MGQKRRSAKMKMAWNQLQLKKLSAPAGCSLWPIWIPSGKCPMERDGPGTKVGIWEQFSRWRWRASLHKRKSQWDLKTLKLTRLGVEKAPVYLLSKCPGIQDHLSPSVLPLHLWRCKWKKDHICILGAGIFFDIFVLLLLANVQMTSLRFSYNPCMTVEPQVKTNYAIAALKLWVLNFSATVSYSMSLWWV